VRVNLAQGDVTVKTWDRPQVQIDADPGVNTERRSLSFPADRDVPIPEAHVSTKDGPVVLPAETFVVSTVTKGLQETIAITGSGNAVVSIPAATPLLIVAVGRGRVTVNDLREGTFIVRVQNGAAILSNVGRDGFVQVMRGDIVASNSAFTRLRARSAVANIWFENCRASQIEVNSVNGSIVYDGGSFAPGLARFESATGPVVLGVTGPATITAHATEGQVYALLDRRSSTGVRGGEGDANLEGGGPTVTAASGSADIYVYNGTIKDRRDLPPSWAPLIARLRRTFPRPAETRPSE
jgi:hypothetical protein